MKGKYICIAGDSGIVTFSNNKGASWANSGQAQALISYHAVHFADTTFGVSVGDAGDAVLYQWVGGLGWAHSPTGLTDRLNAVTAFKTSTSVFTPGNVLTVGDHGAMATYNGSWTILTRVVNTNLKGIHLFPDNSTVLVVGDSGLIMRSPDFGTTWSVLHSGTSEALNDITDGIIPNQFIAVGDSGVIYQSLDGGFNFSRFTVGNSGSNMRGASAKSPQGALGGSANELRVFQSDKDSIKSISDSVFCPGKSFKAYIGLKGLYGSNNTTSLELSDSSGSFNTSVVIGTKVNPQPSDSITGTIPGVIKPSVHYKLRIHTADPFVVSNVYPASLTVYKNLAIPTIQVNITHLFINPQPLCTYQWYYNAGLISGATDTIITAIGNGNYNVQVTNQNGCKISSGVYNYTTTSIKNNDVLSEIAVSPNPTNGLLYIRVSENSKNKIMQIYDVLGKKVFTDVIRSGSNSFNLSSLEDGIYFLNIENYTTKIIVAK
jgi:hypothetical protein